MKLLKVSFGTSLNSYLSVMKKSRNGMTIVIQKILLVNAEWIVDENALASDRYSIVENGKWVPNCCT